MSEDKIKRRNAALKAWETIRKKKAEKEKKEIKKIENSSSQNLKESENKIQKNENYWKGNRVIKLFNKTPSNILCGPFWEIRWAYGCPLNCSYCYLRGTMRGNMKQSYVTYEEIKRCITESFSNLKKPAIFNSGELCDSLMNPKLMKKIVDLFEQQNRHKIFLLSKYGSDHVDFLLEKPRKQTICAWSINSKTVAEKWESGAAKPLDRINAAEKVWSLGYDTRVRVDPIFPIINWKQEYSELMDVLFSKIFPNRIILGTPRGLWKTINYAEKASVNMEWSSFFKEDTSWGKKMSITARIDVYSSIIEKIESFGYPLHNISLCKETPELLDALGLNYKINKCNCYNAN
jgi:spore photoproduct lyase